MKHKCSPITFTRLVCLSASLLVLTVALRAQSRPMAAPSLLPLRATISLTSSLVVLPVRVTDAEGNNISGLTKEDFRVYDDKQTQQLTLFQQEDTPVTVGLLVDHSGSMETKLPNAIAAIYAFAQSSNPQDEMFVVNFNDRVSTESMGGAPFTHDPAILKKAIAAVAPSGRTALYDAVAQGLIHLGLGQQQKKALIVVSDGGDNASQYKRSQVLRLAREAQVTIYSIILVDAFSKDQNPRTLVQLSKDSGGAAFFPESQQAVIKASSLIAEDLRQQYVLGFMPDKQLASDSFRKLQVKVVTPDIGKVQVRTRLGYLCCK
jgi:Ca-activated chloride channel family protein